mmetsp:Transcript_18931/g.26366  ORF Transcript_18931/g.26366 Transcript_18931/m.26366 type:complete len:220 (-) Transcript_18931:618-1277(-)|eukprot:CAMPEP_0184479740 /NCGR_PEP_ID=MMETSP0113_2-20130426/1345_1 /TAXON_ID=91329 /ORGANISM="Norrisiella sphaerica, Strain BC52" /LENGTH=219 /DNA_ID=CAMNT_0026857881 /DNA_START=317 /DNA_END=976 /DNA_ORIENTATION=-
MGCGASHTDPSDIFDFNLAQKVQEYHMELSERQKSKRRNSLQAMCMMFPRVRKGFEALRKSYLELEDKKQKGIELGVLQKADIFGGFEEEKLMEYINESDVDSNNVIDFREYILTLAFIFFLHPEMRQKYDKNLIATYDIVARSWCSFDVDNYGWIKKKKAMNIINGNNGAQMKETIFTEERFHEMDWDRNGEVSFKEFFLAFLEWSGVEFDDGEDGEE